MIWPRESSIPLAALLVIWPAAVLVSEGAQEQRRPDGVSAPEARVKVPLPKMDGGAVEGLIHIRSAKELGERRRELTRLAFGSNSIPGDLRPSEVRAGQTDERFLSLESVASLDLLTVTLDHGIDSKIYHLKSRDPGDTLVIFHAGHEAGFSFHMVFIRKFLEAGYDVLALSMPLVGMNSRPVVDLDRIGPIQLDDHGWLFFLDRPLHYFMEPIAAALNYALASNNYEHVAMVGFSGGGWATTLYAAMDPRIQLSYPVAGSIPNYLRGRMDIKGSSWDTEQHWPQLFGAASYLEMYVMGASGPGRRQVQILIYQDRSFPQAGKHAAYEEAVSRRLRALGPGEFRVETDPRGVGHRLTMKAVKLILADLEQPAGLP